MVDIIQYPDPILHQVSVPIKYIDSPVLDLIDEMLGQLDKCSGIAAVQLGVPIRLIVVRHNPMTANGGLALINPEIVKSKGRVIRNEGCLSIKHGKLQYPVSRAKIVKVKALNLKGETVTYKARDLFGYCLQHEIDHLNGILVNSR